MRGNGDLKIELDPQSPSNEKRHPHKAAEGSQIAQMGYETLDKANPGEYQSKERKGLSRNANYPTRY